MALELEIIDNPAVRDLHQDIVDAANKAYVVGLPLDVIESILVTTAVNGSVKRYGEEGAKALCDIIMQYWHNVRTGNIVFPTVDGDRRPDAVLSPLGVASPDPARPGTDGEVGDGAR